MVIDTSAILAILLQEPEAERFGRAIALASTRLISAASLLEAGMLVHYRFGEGGNSDLDRLIHILRNRDRTGYRTTSDARARSTSAVWERPTSSGFELW
jgi:uncharacterized protein with PIN domain